MDNPWACDHLQYLEGGGLELNSLPGWDEEFEPEVSLVFPAELGVNALNMEMFLGK